MLRIKGGRRSLEIDLDRTKWKKVGESSFVRIRSFEEKLPKISSTSEVEQKIGEVNISNPIGN